MSVLTMAFLGGLISFLSTSLGAFGSFFTTRFKGSFRWNLSLDFALGLMISASAFTLIGPAARGAADPIVLKNIFMAIALGMFFVVAMKKSIDLLQSERPLQSTHLLLVSVLMLHNFPEGLASGAALAGLGWTSSLPILGGISLQNIPEGALMVVCLRALGFRSLTALLGGLGSGLVELAGGTLAGLVLHSVDHVLPLLLSAAGGAMIASVLMELFEGEGKIWQRVWSRQFATGFVCMPIIQYMGS